MTTYRFRVTKPDGTETISDPFDGPERNRDGDLSAPQWASQELGHGDRATLRVQGKRLEGRQIRFVIEHRDASGWVPYYEALGVMKNGVATAEVPIEHPGYKAGKDPSAAASPATLRFHCKVA